jgi:hypothetical protein
MQLSNESGVLAEMSMYSGIFQTYCDATRNSRNSFLNGICAALRGVSRVSA